MLARPLALAIGRAAKKHGGWIGAVDSFDARGLGLRVARSLGNSVGVETFTGSKAGWLDELSSFNTPYW